VRLRDNVSIVHVHRVVWVAFLIGCGGSKPAVAPPGGAPPVARVEPPKPDAPPQPSKPCEANEDCAKRCDANDGASCTRLGIRFDTGKGAPKDADMAGSYFARACTAKDAEGCYQHALEWGDDRTKIVDYTTACDLDHYAACTNLGARYSDGKGVAADQVRGRALSEKACKGGDSTGCSNLGLDLRDGLGGPKDLTRAAEVLRNACDHEEGPACMRLAVMYDDGLGIPKDDAMARLIYKRACDLDHGCNNLGVMYKNGEGGDIDLEKAKALYEKACELSDEMGCVNLARMWARGTLRGDVNLAKAAELFDKACKAGSNEGCTELGPAVDEARTDCQKKARDCTNWGWLTERGIGVPASMQAAVKLYDKACTAGSAISCKNLGGTYRDARGGIAEDRKRALKYFERGCKLNNDDSCKSAVELRAP
jgi:TPR repeat protein